MLFRDRPLLVDGVDAALYLDRPELEQRLVVPLADGRNALVLGDAGSGKSTLLRKVSSLLEAQGRATVIVNAALADEAVDLLDLVGAALDERLGEAGDAQRPHDATSGGEQLLRAVRRLRRDTPTVILVDDLTDAAVGYDTFGRLRDELWALGHAWAVATRPRDSGALRTPPADAFWSTVAIEIPTLDESQTERFLRLGLDDEQRAIVNADRPLSGVHPRQVIRAAQAALGGEAGGSDATPRPHEFIDRASKLGRSEAMAVAELQGLGRPVSAHDPELLERLGWSRPYAQRILSHLAQEEIVRTIPERRTIPGRPRLLYELNPKLPA